MTASPSKRAAEAPVPWRQLSTYLHPDENQTDHAQLRTALLGQLTPTDIIEQIWCDDIVSLVWESHRLRRVKRVMLEVECRGQIRRALDRAHPTTGFLLTHERTKADDIMAAYNQGDEAAVEKVTAAMADNPLTASERVALAHYAMIGDMLSLDRAIEASDKRRDGLLSNLYARRRLLETPQNALP
jgi:hypothetical protein